LFCRTHFITRNRERFKTVRKAVIAAVGKAKAMDLCLTARMMDATEAEKSGGNGDGPRLFCRTHFITRNRQRFKTVRKAVIAAVGKAKAMDLCLTARMMDAAEAEKSGLVARVYPADQLLDETLKAAAVIAGFSLPVVMMVKEADNRAFESSLNEGLLFERRAFHASFGLEDQKEGMAAFVEKRKANFRNR